MTHNDNQRDALFMRLSHLERELAEVKQALHLDREAGSGPEAGGSAASLDPAIIDLFIRYAADFLAVHSPDGRYLFASEASRSLFGWAPEQLIGRSIYEFIHPDDVDRIACNHSRHGREPGARTSDYRMRCADGAYRWVESRSLAHVDEAGVRQIVCVNRDITEHKRMVDELHRVNRVLRTRSMRDSLTALPNRRRLKQRLGQLVREGRRGRRFCCALLDIDHFKNLNDRYGHPAGDEVLRAFAQLLRRNVRDVDLVARFGGEEFVILFVDTGREGALRALEALRSELERARLAPVPVTFSAGVAPFDGDVETGQALLARADSALYQAKRAGRDRISVHLPPASEAAERDANAPPERGAV